MKSVVRIANASGYWGDDPEALLRQVTGGPIDYVTMDFLAEITMVILQRQRARDPKAGFAYDFIEQLKLALPAIAEQRRHGDRQRRRHQPGRLRRGGARRCASEAGVTLPIGVVSGDDLLPRLEALESGRRVASTTWTASAATTRSAAAWSPPTPISAPGRSSRRCAAARASSSPAAPPMRR